jgi:hypothetical protein
VKRAFILALICISLASVTATPQTRRRSPQKRSVRPSATYTEKQQAEIRAGRERIATQIKALTQFVYLLAGIAKTIETAELVNRNQEDTSVALSDKELERNKTRVKESVKSVRVGLDQLEAGFRYNPALQSFYPNLAGVARMGQMAESQAAANRFDQAGHSLIAAINKLADALVVIR